MATHEWQIPIYDRTYYDVQFADENRDSTDSLKGMRNYTDMNRIGNNIRFLAKEIDEIGIILPPMKSRFDWEMSEIPKRPDIANYMADLIALRNTGYIRADTPDVPDLPYMYYGKLNDIEKILQDIFVLLFGAIASFRFSGTFYSGTEEVLD